MTTQTAEAGRLRALLDRLPQHITIESVDEIWIFPPRRAGSTESQILVVSAFDGGGDRRRVITALFTARNDPKGVAVLEEVVAEHGVAPADRIPRLVEGVLRRLDDEHLAAPPRSARIAGDAGRWAELLASLDGETGPI